jgi:hypothetical protein
VLCWLFARLSTLLLLHIFVGLWSIGGQWSVEKAIKYYYFFVVRLYYPLADYMVPFNLAVAILPA